MRKIEFALSQQVEIFRLDVVGLSVAPTGLKTEFATPGLKKASIRKIEIRIARIFKPKFTVRKTRRQRFELTMRKTKI